jgi:tetratricopeptide (TPR) repeat protein
LGGCGDVSARKRAKGGSVIPFEQDHGFYFRVAVRHAMDQDFTRALKYLNKAIELDVFNAEYLFNKACILVELKKTRESIRVLNGIIWKIDPTYSECYFGLGCNYFELGEYTKALYYFERYVSMTDDGEFFDDAYDLLFYMRMSPEIDEEGMGDHFLDCGRLQRHYRTTFAKFHADGSVCLFSGKYREAISKLEKSIMACPETTNARIRLSMAYFMTGQLNLAMLLARSVLKIQKGHHMAKLCLALYYSVDGKQDMSEQMLRLLERIRGKRAFCKSGKLDREDRSFYEVMLRKAQLEDGTKRRLAGVVERMREGASAVER